MPKFRIIAYVVGRPSCPLKPFTGQEVGSGVKAIFRNFARSIAHRVSIKAKPFALESTNAEVRTPYPLYANVQRTVKCFPPIS
jgi:hypothetical protein